MKGHIIKKFIYSSIMILILGCVTESSEKQSENFANSKNEKCRVETTYDITQKFGNAYEEVSEQAFYNSNNNLIELNYVEGNYIKKYEYDSSHKLIKVIQPNSNEYAEYKYDLNNNISEINYFINDKFDFKHIFKYDNNDSLTEHQCWENSNTHLWTNYFFYNDLNQRIKEITYEGNDLTAQIRYIFLQSSKDDQLDDFEIKSLADSLCNVLKLDNSKFNTFINYYSEDYEREDDQFIMEFKKGSLDKKMDDFCFSSSNIGTIKVINVEKWGYFITELINIKRGVKSYVVKKYYDDNDNNLKTDSCFGIEDNRLALKYVFRYEYDNNNNITKRDYFNSDNELRYGYTYKYDINNNLTETTGKGSQDWNHQIHKNEYCECENIEDKRLIVPEKNAVSENKNKYNSQDEYRNNNSTSNVSVKQKEPEKTKCYSCNGTGKCNECGKPQLVRFRGKYGFEDQNEVRYGFIVCSACHGDGDKAFGSSDNYNIIDEPCHLSSCNNGWIKCNNCSKRNPGECRKCEGKGFKN